jgi:hypothetical protein
MKNDEIADSCSVEDVRPHMDREKAQVKYRLNYLDLFSGTLTFE